MVSRLHKFGKQYDENRKNKKSEMEDELLSSLSFQPQISQRSKNIIKGKKDAIKENQKSGYLPLYDSERLTEIENHKKTKIEKLKQEIKEKEEQKKLEEDEILRKVAEKTNSSKYNEMDYMEKFEGYQQAYEKRKKEEQEAKNLQHSDISFKPNLNKKSKNILNKSGLHNFNDRQKSYQEKNKKRRQKLEKEIEHSFKPKINKKSRMLTSRKKERPSRRKSPMKSFNEINQSYIYATPKNQNGSGAVLHKLNYNIDESEKSLFSSENHQTEGKTDEIQEISDFINKNKNEVEMTSNDIVDFFNMHAGGNVGQNPNLQQEVNESQAEQIHQIIVNGPSDELHQNILDSQNDSLQQNILDGKLDQCQQDSDFRKENVNSDTQDFMNEGQLISHQDGFGQISLDEINSEGQTTQIQYDRAAYERINSQQRNGDGMTTEQMSYDQFNQYQDHQQIVNQDLNGAGQDQMLLDRSNRNRLNQEGTDEGMSKEEMTSKMINQDIMNHNISEQDPAQQDFQAQDGLKLRRMNQNVGHNTEYGQDAQDQQRLNQDGYTHEMMGQNMTNQQMVNQNRSQQEGRNFERPNDDILQRERMVEEMYRRGEIDERQLQQYRQHFDQMRQERALQNQRNEQYANRDGQQYNQDGYSQERYNQEGYNQDGTTNQNIYNQDRMTQEQFDQMNRDQMNQRRMNNDNEFRDLNDREEDGIFAQNEEAYRNANSRDVENNSAQTYNAQNQMNNLATPGSQNSAEKRDASFQTSGPYSDEDEGALNQENHLSNIPEESHDQSNIEFNQRDENFLGEEHKAYDTGKLNENDESLQNRDMQAHPQNGLNHQSKGQIGEAVEDPKEGYYTPDQKINTASHLDTVKEATLEETFKHDLTGDERNLQVHEGDNTQELIKEDLGALGKNHEVNETSEVRLNPENSNNIESYNSYMKSEEESGQIDSKKAAIEEMIAAEAKKFGANRSKKSKKARKSKKSKKDVELGLGSMELLNGILKQYKHCVK